MRKGGSEEGRKPRPSRPAPDSTGAASPAVLARPRGAAPCVSLARGEGLPRARHRRSFDAAHARESASVGMHVEGELCDLRELDAAHRRRLLGARTRIRGGGTSSQIAATSAYEKSSDMRTGTTWSSAGGPRSSCACSVGQTRRPARGSALISPSWTHCRSRPRTTARRKPWASPCHRDRAAGRDVSALPGLPPFLIFWV
jgi:hypothetical protein